MAITDFIPDADVMISLEPDELGVRLLPFLAPMAVRGELQLATLLYVITGHPEALAGTPLAINHYPRERKAEVDEAIREAWAWLVGSALLIVSPRYRDTIMVLSRRARKLAKEADPRLALTARSLPKNSLHSVIREDVWSLYHRGKYDTAVFEAMKAVEIAVRQASGLPNKELGVSLMRKAFDKTNGPLADMSMDEGEREMRAHLFVGAIGSYKNPHSHRNVCPQWQTLKPMCPRWPSPSSTLPRTSRSPGWCRARPMSAV